MTPMLFDIIIVLLVVLSLAIGFMRGFCNEVFTIFGWIAAVVATIYFINPVTDFLLENQYVEKEWIARLGGAAAIFIATMGICSLITYFVTKTLHSSKLGIVDRCLGFAFGALRAIVLLGLAFLLFTYVFSDPDKRPDFVQKAQTRPILESAAAMVQTILPIGEALEPDAEKNAEEKIDDVKKSIDESAEKIKESAETVKDAGNVVERARRVIDKPEENNNE